MTIATPFTRLFGIRHPILLAPMAWISGGALAAAVTRAGGLGLLGGGYGDRPWLERELALAGDAGVGTGFISWSLPRHPGLLEMVLERSPRAVMLSFGELRPFAGRIKASATKLICQVQTVAAARDAVAAGADVVVAQGTEAGGHGGLRATLPLVPAVVDAVAPVPVLAAGGIADGRGLAAALMLGAAGVLMGTAFYASEEALVHPAAKARLVEASGDATTKGAVFDMLRGIEWPAPYALRTLENAFSRRWSGDLEGLRASLDEQRRVFEAAREAGDFDTAGVFAGEAADLVRRVEPAAAIVERVVAEAELRLAGAATLLD